MAETLTRSGWQDILRSLGITTVFCICIAVLIWMLSGQTAFWSTLGVSLCIGLSINLSFILLTRHVERYLNPYLAPIPITAIGLIAGLSLGGILAVGQPLFFFTESYVTSMLGVFFAILAFIFFGTRTRLMEARAELANARLEAERQEKLLTRTELKLLQAQIEPHFLFNTLSNIAGLIHKDADAAEQTLLNLTTLLRSSLDRTRATDISLRGELDVARAYLDIQAIRMQDRLKYAFKVDHRLDELRVPPLLIQPLIENAIKHGLDPLEQGGRIDINCSQANGMLMIEVADSGVGLSCESSGTGTGLVNVRERLKALYGHAADLRLTGNEGGGMTATIEIPLS